MPNKVITLTAKSTQELDEAVTKLIREYPKAAPFDNFGYKQLNDYYVCSLIVPETPEIHRANLAHPDYQNVMNENDTYEYERDIVCEYLKEGCTLSQVAEWYHIDDPLDIIFNFEISADEICTALGLKNGSRYPWKKMAKLLGVDRTELHELYIEYED